MKKNKFFIAIFIIITMLVIFCGYKIYSTYFCSTEITAVDNSFKITIPNRVKYKIKESNEEKYSLEFYSVKDEMFFYSTVIDKKSNINLEEAISNEKNNLSSNLKDVKIISDVSKITISNYNSYKYSYTYKDENYGNELYAEVVWIETDSKIYILDLEVITKNMKKYQSIFESIESSFVEIH